MIIVNVQQIHPRHKGRVSNVMDSSTADAVWTIPMIVMVMTILVVGGCNMSDYTPSVDDVNSKRNGSHPFILEPLEIVGLYGNMDVDSLIYSYETKIDKADTFWATIDRQSQELGWELVKENKEYRQYDLRGTHPGGMKFIGQVRIAFDPDTFEVLVAWVREELDEYPPPSEDGRFAKNDLWPRFNDFIKLNSGE